MTTYPQPVLRAASADDATALADLSAQLGYPASEAEIRQRLEAVAVQAGNRVLVAATGDGIVGWIHTFIACPLESAPFAEIGGLVVDRNHRGRGYGRLLVEASIAWAQAQGVDQIRVRSNVQREAAHRFYAGIGFACVKSQKVFSLAIGSGPSPDPGPAAIADKAGKVG